MSLGGSEQTGMQTTTQLPPSYVLPQLAYGANEAQRMYSAGTGFGYYPENTVAGFSPEQQMAMNLQGNRALSGSPLTREGQSLGLNTLRGRLGSGANQNALTRALSTPLMQNYENERSRQNAMLSNVPALANQDYTDYAQLAAVGQNRQNQAQRQIEANKSRFDFLQAAPQQRLGNFLGNLNSAAGGAGTTSQPLYENKNAEALSNTATLLSILKGL